MIKLIIQSMTWILIIFISNTYAQYDLSTNEGKKLCQSDPNCYLCKDNGMVQQCIQLSPYDNQLGVINMSRQEWVCNASSTKEICDTGVDRYKHMKQTIRIENDINLYQFHSVDVSLTSNDLLVIKNKTTYNIDLKEDEKLISYIHDGWNISGVNVIANYTGVPVLENSDGNIYHCPVDGGSSQYKLSKNQSISIDRLISIKMYGSCGFNPNQSYYIGYAQISSLVIDIEIEKPITTITCPSDNNKSCYKEGKNYFCNPSLCTSGNEIIIEEVPSYQGAPVIKPPKKEGIGDGGCVEDIRKITIGEGTFGSCRLSSKTNALADNCCKLSINDRDKQEDIMTGVADVISVLGGTFSLISDFFAAIGWTDGDFIQVLLTDVMEFLKGGTCSNDEIAIATAAAATQGIVVNNNGIIYDGNHDTGTCVYLGDYCSNYSGYCDKGSFLGIKWENPIGWGCERPAKAYCCFSSMFEKALAKAAREQMPDKYNWGTIREQRVGPYNSKAGIPYTPGNNPCKPDFKELNIDCGGVSVFDLVNINMDSEQFQTDMAAFTAITLKDITKEEGNYQQAQENMQQEIENLKNQSNNNSSAIINNTLDGVDINKFK